MPTAVETTPILDIFRVTGSAGKIGMPGAPMLHFELLVHGATGILSGTAVQTQALAPPHNQVHINIKEGFKLPVGPDRNVISMQGTALISFSPPAIGCYLTTFEAAFIVDDKWNGVGSWKLGNSLVNDVPVHALP